MEAKNLCEEQPSIFFFFFCQPRLYPRCTDSDHLVSYCSGRPSLENTKEIKYFYKKKDIVNFNRIPQQTPL